MLLAWAPILQTSQAIAQVTVMHETFDDRDLSANPVWTGDLDDFSFAEEYGNTLLRLDTEPDPSRTQITTLSTTHTGSWEFYFRQDFSPSNLNRAFIFLMADRNDLNYLDGSNVNGYAVRTGDNQSPRRLKLVRFDNGNQTVLSESETELEEGAGYRVKIIRTEDGTWRMLMSEGYESEPMEDAPSVTDLTHTESTYFGLLMRYSAGNVNNFYFDDFIISSFEPFKLQNAEVAKAREVSLLFNYPLDPNSVSANSVYFDGLPQPVMGEAGPADMQARFVFENVIPDGEYSVEVANIRSEFGDELTGPSQMGFSFENPFYVIESEITDERTIRIEFSEPIDSASFAPSNFITSNSLQPAFIHHEAPGIIELEYSSELPSGAVTVQFQNIKSVNSWEIIDGTEITSYRFDEATEGGLAINEILYRRAEANAPQFVEIFNNTERAFNLSGWRLETGRGWAVLPHGAVITGSNYMVLTDDETFAARDDRIIYLAGFQPMRTTGDAVLLRNTNGAVIDSLYYFPEWGGSRAGVSLERKDPRALSIDPVNWAESNAETGSTPLEENSRYKPDISPPDLEFAAYLPGENKVMARFNEFVKILPETAFYVDGNRVHPLGAGHQPGPELYFDFDGFSANRDYVLEIEQISDYQDNISDRLMLPVSRPVEPGGLVFNEIMYDPLQDDYNGLPNQTEYIEIYNTRNYAISLEGIYIHDRPNDRGEVSKIEPASSKSVWIPAKGYALLQAENDHQEFLQSGNARFFGLPEELAAHALRFARASLSLPMAGREVYLADSLGQVIDMVDYSPGWHNPNLIDKKGISLERINPSGDTNDSANWGSNTMAVGGTPGSENSIFQIPAGATSADNISLEPNPFSPHGDGHEDNLFINYSFDEPDFMLRVRIFDRYGRLVRNLADSHPAGFEGALIWDGRMDNGVTGRIGIYIVHIEAVNSMSGKRKQFKETVVLARQF